MNKTKIPLYINSNLLEKYVNSISNYTHKELAVISKTRYISGKAFGIILIISDI